MAPAFSKEAILQGSIDYLCLVCESYLRSECEVSLHVATATHKLNLDTTDYVDKYRPDRVRKVKKWYFCEFCNVLVSTITKVRLHVEEPRHKDNIARQMIDRVDDVIVSGNTAISEEAWQGFIDENTCTICNVEFEDKVNHRNETTHIINLIQSKVTNDLDNIYRKIDDSTFHCLTCNTVVAEITAHFDDTKHKDLTQKCIKVKPLIPEEYCKTEDSPGKCSAQSITKKDITDDKNNISNENANCCSEVTNNNIKSMKLKAEAQFDEHISTKETKDYIIYDCDGKAKSTLCNSNFDLSGMRNHLADLHHQSMLKNNTSDILDSIPKFQKESININLENCTAVCRRCSVNLEYNCKSINNHIEGHKNIVHKQANETTPILFEKDENNEKAQTKSNDIKKQNEENAIEKLVEEHDLTYASNKIYCQRCSKHIPAAVKNIKEHVNGENHKKNTRLMSVSTPLRDKETKKMNTKKVSFQRVPLNHFIRTMTTVRNRFAEDVVINEKYCINILAFTYLTVTAPGRLKCEACIEDLHIEDMKEHVGKKKHERILNEVPVIIHTDSEFIREIRSETFQCGICNIIGTWDEIENHLKSISHKESKTFSNWRLAQYMPLFEQRRVERHIHNDFITRLMFS